MIDHLSLIERFLEVLVVERGFSQNSIESYERDLKNFAAFNKDRRVDEINQDHCKAYLNVLYQRRLTPTTVARHLSSLGQFFRFLLEEGLVQHDPFTYVDRPKPSRRLPNVLSVQDVLKLLETAASLPGNDGKRAVAMLELFYATGMRVSELVALPRQAFRPPASLFIKGKGNKERLLPLHDTAVAALETHLASLPPPVPQRISWIFPSSSPAKHMTRQRCGQILKEIALRAGIEPSMVHPHILRHAFATHLLEGGADLLSVQKLLGHAHVSTTEIYTHLTTSHLKEAVFNAHPLGRSKAKGSSSA